MNLNSNKLLSQILQSVLFAVLWKIFTEHLQMFGRE